MGCTGTSKESWTKEGSNGENERAEGRASDLVPGGSQLVSVGLSIHAQIPAQTPHFLFKALPGLGIWIVTPALALH